MLINEYFDVQRYKRVSSLSLFYKNAAIPSSIEANFESIASNKLKFGRKSFMTKTIKVLVSNLFLKFL